MCILFVYIYTLLKVVNYYDMSVLSMSVRSMGFQQKSFNGGWVGGVNPIQSYFGFLEFL